MATEQGFEEGYADQRDVEQLKADLFGIDDEDDDADELVDADALADEDADQPAQQLQDSDDEVGVKRKRAQADSDDDGDNDGGSGQKRAKQLENQHRAQAEVEDDEQDSEPLEDYPDDGDADNNVVEQNHAAHAENGDEEDVGPTAEDNAFIDDTGVEADEGYGDEGQEEEEDVGPIPEAEEAEEGEEDELETMLKGKRRQKNKEDSAAIEREMCIFLANMDLAAEEDVEAHRLKKPAFSKLKMLRKVEEFLARVTYHDEFLRQGGLGSLKGWLQYYEDGTLPHLRVRSSVLRILDKLPINTMFEEHKQWLAKSMVGQLVMFYMKCRDEVQENKRMAKALVEKWSKPIFETSQQERKMMHAGDEEERLEARKQRKQMEQQMQAAKEEELEKAKKLTKGDAGFRWHASVPQASKLDYVRQPESLAQPPDRGERQVGKKEVTRFDRKIRDLSRKKNAAGLKAQNVSVQGRGLYMMK